MNKIITFLSLSFLLFNYTWAQTTDTVDMNGGYAMDVFYSLDNGTAQTVAGSEWTVAFSTSATTSSIYINDGRGAKLYETSTAVADFATLDTAGLSTWAASYNDYKSWNTSAFEANATGHPNYGWGSYDSNTHIVTGDKVFVVKTLGGEYYKTLVVKKQSGAWHYRYATLDNSFDTTLVYQASDLQTKNFAYLNMDNHVIADREPAKTDWDMLFTKYYDVDIPYKVTGVLINQGVEVVEINNTKPADADYANGTFESTTKVIGSDWKMFNNTIFAYQLDTMKTFFVKQLDGDIYKIHFTRFDGMSTGVVGFTKEKMVGAPIKEIASINSISLYPNPAQNNAYIALDMKENTTINYSVLNVLGKTMSSKETSLSEGLNVLNLNLDNVTTGMYFVKIQEGNKVKTLRLNVSK